MTTLLSPESFTPPLAGPAGIDTALLNESSQSDSRAQAFIYQLQQMLKRLLDLTLASIGILFMLPIFIIITLGIWLLSPGPVFYKSLRIGKGQRPFYMLKFRTMIVDADKLRDQLRQETGQEGQLFKLKEDRRVTKFGAFLRKYSLDEFPQLINVLRGEMSLVGPRPFSPDNCVFFTKPYDIRFRATPGMTGLWQVSGRSNLNFEQVCQLDLSYILTWSLLKDILILCKTPSAVLLKRGAC